MQKNKNCVVFIKEGVFSEIAMTTCVVATVLQKLKKVTINHRPNRIKP